MAAGILPQPGTSIGPCAGDCQHTDCAETRRMAAAFCDWCDEPIGYGVRFYRLDPNLEAPGRGELVHARCEELAALDDRVRALETHARASGEPRPVPLDRRGEFPELRRAIEEAVPFVGEKLRAELHDLARPLARARRRSK